jgi:hypothetical protein
MDMTDLFFSGLLADFEPDWSSGAERGTAYSEKIFSSGRVAAALSFPSTRRTKAGHQSCCASSDRYASSAAHVLAWISFARSRASSLEIPSRFNIRRPICA